MKNIFVAMLLVVFGIATAYGSKFDHFSVVVHNLESTIHEMEGLGFTVKRGTDHGTGILNAFIKIEGGGYIEMISVKNPSDDLARYYAKVLKEQGEVPVFIAFEKSPLHHANGLVMEKWKDFSTLSYPFSSPLRSYFLIEYHKKADDSAYVKHDNGVYYINELHVGEIPKEQKLDPQFFPLPVFFNYRPVKNLVSSIVFQMNCNSKKKFAAFTKFHISFEANPICGPRQYIRPE